MSKGKEKKIVKKVLSHIKEDDKEFRKQISDDKKLEKTIKKVGKK
jgi:hypothetical protein